MLGLVNLTKVCAIPVYCLLIHTFIENVIIDFKIASHHYYPGV